MNQYLGIINPLQTKPSGRCKPCWTFFFFFPNQAEKRLFKIKSDCADQRLAKSLLLEVNILAG